MPLFAKNENETISAWDAVSGKCYECLECNTPLKLRHSKKKFPHFYHLAAPRTCRLSSKSEKHLLIQYEIQKRLPGAILEKSFPVIQRIADVVWENFVFEIQCSFITEKEAQDRVQEYRSLGYKVIWFLDDARFNRRRVSAAENWMRKNQCCYYVDQNFVFYDQLETIHKQRRIQRGRKLPIQLIPLQRDDKIYFKNDALDRALEPLPKPKKVRDFFQRFIRAPYIALLNSLLKIDCRS